LDLAYQVECDDEVMKLNRRRRKLRARLGPYGSKPARMRWRTFWRIRNMVDALDQKLDALLVIAYARSMGFRR
jgi:hypothetical protein